MLHRYGIPVAGWLLGLGVLGAAGCHAESYGSSARVQIPRADAGPGVPGPRGRGRQLRSGQEVEVGPGTGPSGLRPHPRVRVIVPRNEVLPRGVHATDRRGH